MLAALVSVEHHQNAVSNQSLVIKIQVVHILHMMDFVLYLVLFH